MTIDQFYNENSPFEYDSSAHCSPDYFSAL